jgi:hypothetical protein
MLRIILGVIVGFLVWGVLWFAGEQLLSAVWPAFGAHQAAFQAAIENGGAFTSNSTMLAIHIVLASIVSVVAGFLAALVAGENKRAPLIVGILLLCIGILKVVMSWPLVPIWYHFLYTAVLLPMAIVGGRLKAGTK